MVGPTRIGVFAWAFALISALCAEAVKPSVWRADSREAFSEGEPENVSITSEGHVTLAPSLDEIAAPDVENVWCLAQDAEGVLYAGTGNSGKVLRISSDGDVSVLFDSPEVGIQSLAFDEKGDLYAGSSPDGLVYRIRTDGEANVFCATGEAYVWALTFGPDGELYAGTGTAGKILRISPRGEAEIVYDTPDPHVMCLASDQSGTLYAGTEGSGVVYRIDQKGAVRVLYDTPEREVHALAMAPNGLLYAGTIPGSARDTASDAKSVSSESVRVESVEQGVIYALAPSGAAERIWSSTDHLLLSMVVKRDGNLVVGTGNRGVLFEVRPDGKAAELAKCRDEKPLCMIVDDEGDILVGTGGPGRIHRLTSSYAEEGTLTSEAHDHRILSRWGRISWRAEIPAETQILFQTRSGNTEQPDDTWSPWSEELTHASDVRIPSPPGRFLQYRATLSTSDGVRSPVLREVTLMSAQENLRPRVEAVQCYPYEAKSIPVSSGSPSSQAQLQKRPIKRGLRVVKWDAVDPNGDDLVYSILFRGAGEKDWKLLEEDLLGISHIWDTESAPDGTAQLKVIASDRLDNSSESALSGEALSAFFEVDNTAPTIHGLQAKAGESGIISVQGEAEDATSFIRKGEYAVDAGRWQVIQPEDGIFDSGREAFAFTAADLLPGEHTIVVRMTDALKNVATARATVELE